MIIFRFFFLLVAAALTSACSQHIERQNYSDDRLIVDEPIKAELPGGSISTDRRLSQIEQRKLLRRASLWEKGRPKNFYDLVFSQDPKVCPLMLKALGEPRAWEGRISRNPNAWSEVLLGNENSIVWKPYLEQLYPHRYALFDLNNDGLSDLVFRYFPTYKGVGKARITFLLRRQEDENEWGEIVDHYLEDLTDPRREFSNLSFGRKFIDWRNLELQRDSFSLAFGQYKDFITIDEVTYFLVGASSEQSLREHPHSLWVVKIKNQLNSERSLQLLCEFSPNFIY